MLLKDTDFKRLFELSGDAMVVFVGQTFVYCNPAALRIFACPSMDLFCTKSPDDFSPEFQPCGTPSSELAARYSQDTMRDGYKRFEWLHKRLNGEEFYADILLNLSDWMGEPVILAIVRDISSYKALQNSLLREKERSELATRAKSEFLAVMSHEIRTPLNGILGAQELLLDAGLNSEQYRLAALAMTSSRHLLKIVNNVLDFSKIDAGKLILEEIPFDATELISDLHSQFELEASIKSINLELRNEPKSQCHLLGDAHRILQILSNLISNAIKFTEAGGSITLSSHIQEEAANSYRWRVTVTDTGIGMTGEQQRAVFEPFSQADTSVSRQYGGTGLGLSISQALVELLGGSITVRSQLGNGSTFSIELPMCKATVVEPSPTELLTTRQRNYRQSILVAEDNPTNQYIIKKKLERLGLQAVVVDNGREALASYQDSLGNNGNSRFAAILMDVQMPILNGIETTRQLRDLGCELPIFALTADVLSERKQQCLDAGMQAFVGKPFEDSRLVELFDYYL